MDKICLQIKIEKNDEFVEKIREQGLFFETIADALNIDRENITEIDESNYKILLNELEK